MLMRKDNPNEEKTKTRTRRNPSVTPDASSKISTYFTEATNQVTTVTSFLTIN